MTRTNIKVTQILPATYELIYEAMTHGAQFFLDVGILIKVPATTVEKTFYELEIQNPTNTYAAIERNDTADFIEKITLYHQP